MANIVRQKISKNVLRKDLIETPENFTGRPKNKNKNRPNPIKDGIKL